MLYLFDLPVFVNLKLDGLSFFIGSFCSSPP
jgi:hypothetical protein